MPTFRRLLRHSLAVLAVTTGLVAASYTWVDRPVATSMLERGIVHSETLEWLQDFPMLLNALSPAIALYAMVKLAFAPLGRWERTALAASVSLMIAIALEWYLKGIAGRYWPSTWLQPPNPSYLGTGDYGFHLFHFGRAYDSFPSGHTLRAASFLGVYAIAYPRTRWLCLAAVAVVMAALVGKDYHFVSDTLAGAAVGYLTARYTAACFGLDQPRGNSSIDFSTDTGSSGVTT